MSHLLIGKVQGIMCLQSWQVVRVFYKKFCTLIILHPRSSNGGFIKLLKQTQYPLSVHTGGGNSVRITYRNDTVVYLFTREEGYLKLQPGCLLGYVHTTSFGA